MPSDDWDATNFLHSLAHKGKHDMGASIRAVRSFSGLLATECGDSLSEDASAWLGFIQRAAEELTLTNQRVALLASMDEPEQQGLELDAAKLFTTLAAKVGIEFFAPPTAMVYADQRCITLIATELLDNAMRYGAAPARLEQPAANTLLFTDTGEGIAEDQLHDAAQAFHRLVPKSHSPGVGLGFTICERAMSLQGGTFSLGSRPSGLEVLLKFGDQTA